MMSEGPTSRDKSAAPKGNGRMVFAGVIAAAVIALILFVVSRNGDENGGGGPVADHPMLDLTRSALAATENLATEEADASWQTLFERTPDDPSVALNRALNRVLRVDRLSEQAMDPSAEQAQKTEARKQLSTSAIGAAEKAIDDYARLAPDSNDNRVIALWLNSRIELHEAELLLGSMTRRIQKDVFKTLVSTINGESGESPASIVLAGPLTDVLAKLEDPSTGLPADLLQDAATAVTNLYEKNPDNLFLAINAARLNIETENPNAKDLVLRTQSLSKAIEPILSQTLKPIGFTASEMIDAIVQAIDEGRWSDASQNMQFWFNVLNPTEIVKADRRRASPHPLDRLSFDALRRLEADAVGANPIGKRATEIAFRSSAIDGPADTTVVCPIDYDLNLEDDLATISGEGVLKLWNQEGEKWTAAGELSLDVRPSGMRVVDLFMVDESHPQRLKSDWPKSESGTYRHNAFPSLIVYGDDGIRIVSIDGRNKTDAQDRLSIFPDSGLDQVRGVNAVTAGDMEGDGDLDLVVATNESVRIFINRGNRTFFEIENSFESDDPVTGMAIADLDRDLDLDVVTIHRESGRVGLLENLLHLQFRSRILMDVPAIADVSFIAVADVDANVSWDLVVGGSSQRAIVFSQTADVGVWTVDRVETSDVGLTSGAIADFDNDSWSELVGAHDSTTDLTRLGPWGLGDSKSIEPSAASQFALANFNSDGKVDLVCLNGSTPTAMINQTDSDGHHLNVRFRGIADNAASSGRVNHFGIGSVLELRFGPHYRSRIITTPETHFGLGGFDSASSVRVILPNGLTQTIRDPKVDTVVEEEQKLKGSCPYLYAWDGEKFVFMTDCLWAAPLGLQVARGVVAKDRPWEYLKVDGRRVKPRDDRYEFRITEELWEVAYIDKLALTAVDRPADVEIWTNEKVGPGDIATPTIFAFRKDELKSLRHAVDTNGRDVTAQLARADQDYVQGFDRRLRQGLCPPHWVDLDFGDLNLAPKTTTQTKPSVFMVLTGWILPTDTSLNIQIDQNPGLPAIEFPSVWVPDAKQPDGWRKAIPFMGFPGGKTKTIVVDVTDVLEAEDPRLRIRTSAQIYWDSARLAIQTDPPKINVQDLELLSAEVSFHGFSKRIEGGPQQPASYDYQKPTLAAIWPPLRGSLTRFGECTEMIRQWDDQMAVISSGDEIQFSFAVPDAEVPEGWQRDFVLHCVGWDKDADLNTLAGQSIGPLPHRKMASYPPSVTQSASTKVVENANRRHRNRRQSFRSFWYRDGVAEPSRFVTPPINGSGESAE